MKSATSIAGHPVHPMLIPLPIGLWIFSLVCDVIHLATGQGSWETSAFYTLVGGTVTALLAALPGLWDLYKVQRSRAKVVGIWHLCLNLGIVALSTLNAVWRWNAPFGTGQLALSAVAVVLLVVSGWLGGEMVYVHGVAVVPVPPERYDRKE